MKENKIDIEIVESARIFGQWLNQTAYKFADKEVATDIKDRKGKINQVKSKILMQIENDAANASTPQDMIFRTSIRACRMLQRDVPSQAARFIDAVNSGSEISFTEARQMLLMYLRMRNEN